MTDCVKFLKTKEVKTPTKATVGSIGFDLFLPCDVVILPVCDRSEAEDYLKELTDINDNTTIIKGLGLIDSGLRFQFPENYYAEVKPRSSGFKNGLIVIGEIDNDFTGEIKIAVANLTQKIVRYAKDSSFAQLKVYKQTERPELVEVDFIMENTSRSSGGFGSTGNL